LSTISNSISENPFYGVANYPTALNPATGGCRNMTGRHNHDDTVTLFAITSTLSANGDQGADPNKLVKVTDALAATKLPVDDGVNDRDDRIGHFVVIRSAKAGEVFRGMAFAPVSMVTTAATDKRKTVVAKERLSWAASRLSSLRGQPSRTNGTFSPAKAIPPGSPRPQTDAPNLGQRPTVSRARVPFRTDSYPLLLVESSWNLRDNRI
jgi:hypothetical protein